MSHYDEQREQHEMEIWERTQAINGNKVKLEVGSKLISKNINSIGNGVVYSVPDDLDIVMVLTDFGNILYYPLEDLLRLWDIRPSSLTLQNRIKLQIELLTKVLEGLNNGEQ